MEDVLGGPQYLAGGFRVGRLTEDVLASDAHRAEAEPPMSKISVAGFGRNDQTGSVTRAGANGERGLGPLRTRTAGR